MPYGPFVPAEQVFIVHRKSETMCFYALRAFRSCGTLSGCIGYAVSESVSMPYGPFVPAEPARLRALLPRPVSMPYGPFVPAEREAVEGRRAESDRFYALRAFRSCGTQRIERLQERVLFLCPTGLSFLRNSESRWYSVPYQAFLCPTGLSFLRNLRPRGDRGPAQGVSMPYGPFVPAEPFGSGGTRGLR